MRKKQAVILGAGSDIGRGIADRLRRDGWGVTNIRHNQELGPNIVPKHWDLIVCCYGMLDPIGLFWNVDLGDWHRSWRANFFLPVQQVRTLYSIRAPGASVCFFSGAGMNGPAPTYSAYCAAKVALVKMVELMDDESDDCKFFVLGPGMMRTKIQYQTIAAGPRAANYERVNNFMSSEDNGTLPVTVYEFLMACVAAPKSAVGGRNFYVPGDDPARLGELFDDPHALKLRRRDDAVIRCAP